MLALFALQFLALGLAASVVGCVVALGGQQLLVMLLGAMVSADLPPPGLAPAVAAIATGLLMLLGFALPPLFALSKVPPLRVLRRDIGMPRAGGSFAYILGAATVALLIGWQAQDVKTGAIMVGGIAAMLITAAVMAWSMIALLRLLPQRGYSWRYGLANLRRRPLGSSLQIGALGLGLMSLLLLTLVRGDLMRNWRASLPADAPNAFLVNVLPDQVNGVRAMLKRELSVDAQLSPMVRGRLVAINDKPLDTTRLAEEGARRLGEREFNLSWADTPPRGNRVVAGQWWKPGESEGVSLEEGIAQTLGIKLGDTLTYDIVGTRVSAKVTSLRKVDWDSFRPNFFTLFAPGVAVDEAAPDVLGRLRRLHPHPVQERLQRVAAGRGQAGVLDVVRRDVAVYRGARQQRKRLADSVAARISQRAGDRRGGDPAAGADHHRAGGARSRIRLPLYAARRSARARSRNRGDAGRAPPRRRHFAHTGREPTTALGSAGGGIRRARRIGRPRCRRRRNGDRLCARRSCVSDSVRVESLVVAVGCGRRCDRCRRRRLAGYPRDAQGASARRAAAIGLRRPDRRHADALRTCAKDGLPAQ